MSSRTFKIEYEHEGGSKDSYFLEMDPTLSEDELGKELMRQILDKSHKYRGSLTKDGHGDFTAVCTEHNRPDDATLADRIYRYNQQITKLKGAMKRVGAVASIPYEQIGEPIVLKQTTT